MNKNECKKYIKRAYRRLNLQGKSMTPKNLEIEMKNIINNESDIYISYAKIAMHNLNNSATEINAKQLELQIDVIPTIYNEIDAIKKAEKL